MYWKYFKYVLRHKWFVFLECCKVGLLWRGLIHDLSKLRLSEFIPYARYFYGNYPEYINADSRAPRGLFKQDIEHRFDKAWLFHIHRNPHHWQFWLLQEDDGPLKNIPVPIKYLKEMLCDWHGAGRAITGKSNTKEWYIQNKKNINLNRINRKWIEKKLGIKTKTAPEPALS